MSNGYGYKIPKSIVEDIFPYPAELPDFIDIGHISKAYTYKKNGSVIPGASLYDSFRYKENSILHVPMISTRLSSYDTWVKTADLNPNDGFFKDVSKISVNFKGILQGTFPKFSSVFVDMYFVPEVIITRVSSSTEAPYILFEYIENGKTIASKYYYKANFYEDQLPTAIILELQAAGGGGAATRYPVVKAGGGGAGAHAVVVLDFSISSTFKLIFSKVGLGGKGGYRDSTVYTADGQAGSAITLAVKENSSYTSIFTVAGGFGGSNSAGGAGGNFVPYISSFNNFTTAPYSNYKGVTLLYYKNGKAGGAPGSPGNSYKDTDLSIVRCTHQTNLPVSNGYLFREYTSKDGGDGYITDTGLKYGGGGASLCSNGTARNGFDYIDAEQGAGAGGAGNLGGNGGNAVITMYY